MDKSALTDDGKDVAESRHVWSGSAIRALQEAYREAKSALAEVTKERDRVLEANRKWAAAYAARDAELAECRKDLQREREKFQNETRRTSALTVLLLEFANVYSYDHYAEPWPKACMRCDLLRRTKELIDSPVNDLAQQSGGKA